MSFLEPVEVALQTQLAFLHLPIEKLKLALYFVSCLAHSAS